MKWWQVYVVVFSAALVLAVIFTMICRKLAYKFDLLDKPLGEGHKKHGKATPLMGGVAMFSAWFLTIGMGLLMAMAFDDLVPLGVKYYLTGIQIVIPQLIVIVVGALLLVVLGLVDDKIAMGPLPKFIGQFVVAGAVARWGVHVTLFWDNPLIVWAITTFWILFLINAVNFFDNMDGLSAGVSMIAAFMFLYIAASREQYFVSMLASATCGATAGFLIFNKPPASIFMGDSGSHFLGYLLAVIGALTTYYTPGESRTLVPVLIPVLILAVLIFDVAAVVLIRLHLGKPIYVGDHNHLSHRFLEVGLTRAQAVYSIYLLSIITGCGAISLMWLPVQGVTIILLQVAAVLVLITMLQFYGRNIKEGKSDVK